MKKIPVLIALDDELPNYLPEPFVKIITGIGKVNAAVAIMRSINEYNPDVIINFGTAGSLNAEYKEGIYKVARVAQRDLDLRAIGFQLGQASNKELVWYSLDNEESRPTLTSGDQFVNALPEMESDLVDMEAAVYAKICKEYNIELSVYKFVSDNADDLSSDVWKANCHQGASLFMEVLKNVV